MHSQKIKICCFKINGFLYFKSWRGVELLTEKIALVNRNTRVDLKPKN